MAYSFNNFKTYILWRLFFSACDEIYSFPLFLHTSGVWVRSDIVTNS